jgi:hypothetical protein
VGADEAGSAGDENGHNASYIGWISISVVEKQIWGFNVFLLIVIK